MNSKYCTSFALAFRNTEFGIGYVVYAGSLHLTKPHY